MLDPIPFQRYTCHTDDAIELSVSNQPRVTRRTLFVLLAASLSLVASDFRAEASIAGRRARRPRRGQRRRGGADRAGGGTRAGCAVHGRRYRIAARDSRQDQRRQGQRGHDDSVGHHALRAVSRFFTGTAGAIDPELRPADVVIATAIGYHDFGAATASGFVRRPTNNPATGGVNPAFFPPAEWLLSAARRLAPTVKLTLAPGTTHVPVVREGVVVTGDAFVGDSAQRDELRRSLKASAVEMEGAAVAQVSTQLGVPFLVIRSITDSADGSTPDAYRKNLDAASRNAAALTLAVLAHLAK